MSEFECPPLPVFERVEIVPLPDARASVSECRPLLTDRYGSWFCVKYGSVPGSKNVVARLRLALPTGGLPHATLAELDSAYGVKS